MTHAFSTGSDAAAWRDATRHQPCPICGGDSWCSTSESGVTLCRREDRGGEGRVDRNGAEYWVHGNSSTRPLAVPEMVKGGATPAPVEVRDRVYRSLLGSLSLSSSHRKQLRERGLEEAEIARREYRTLPRRDRPRIARSLVEQWGERDCAGVPGLIVRKWDGRPGWTLAGPAGLLIPVRDPEGRIVALRIRLDEPGEVSTRYLWFSSTSHDGPGPGAAAHVPLFDGDRTHVRLTEGELKADVATLLSDRLTLSLPGATVLGPVLPLLRELGTKTVLLALDADARRNPHVARGLARAHATLLDLGYEVALELWNAEHGKGIDDVLAAGHPVRCVTGAAVAEAVGEIQREAGADRPRHTPPAAAAGPDDRAPSSTSPPGGLRRKLGDPAPAEIIHDELAVGLARLSNSDDDNARRLVERFGRDLRYCARWGGWLVWDGACWVHDEAGQSERMAIATARAILLEGLFLSGKEKRARLQWHRQSRFATRLKAMLWVARSELPIRPEELDLNPWLLNTPTGTLDLRTGALHPHRREDFLTRVAPVPYLPDAKAPTWERFLAQITGGDPALGDYLRRVAGFCLTGIEPDRVMFFLYGTGRNGKSTFVNALHALLGSYAKKTSAETLLARPNGDGIPNDLADLRGARLVTSAELTEGRRLNEGRIKDLTGRDTIKARFLHQEFFEFRPTFKLFMYGNHRPVVRGSDEGIWDRVKLIPFEVRISDADRDEHLPEKLQAELPGILNWALRGCREWQEQGLAHPEKVRVATRAYREEQDPLRDFLTDCCVIHAGARVDNPALWSAYSTWCTANGERSPLGRKQFTQRLTDRGFVPKNVNGRHWVGIGILDPNHSRTLPAETTLHEAKSGVSENAATHEEENPEPSVRKCEPYAATSLPELAWTGGDFPPDPEAWDWGQATRPWEIGA